MRAKVLWQERTLVLSVAGEGGRECGSESVGMAGVRFCEFLCHGRGFSKGLTSFLLYLCFPRCNKCT